MSEKNPSLLFQSPVFDLFIQPILIPWEAFVALYTVLIVSLQTIIFPKPSPISFFV